MSAYVISCRITKRLLCQRFNRNARMMSSPVRLQILPSRWSLFDEPLQIKVRGLDAEQKVELRTKLTDDKGTRFKSSASYIADYSGTINLATSPSLGGSYSGIEPMGLFWSMTSETPHAKLWKKSVLSPCLVDVEVFNSSDREHALAKETIERGFMAQGTRRVPVKVGRIRGTLFVPPGRGQFPGILDLYTLGGALTEVRGCLLANKGFVVLCLAFYRYDDLPTSVSHLDLEYFEEALMFLRNQPEVKGPGVGVISISKSGDLALSISSFLPNVAATVWINGCTANTVFPLHYKGMVIPPLMSDVTKITITSDGIMDIRDAVTDPMAKGNEAALIPIERANCSFLFVASEDDRNWNSYLFADQAANRLKYHGKDNYEVVKYPKAGHFLEVPYMPHYPSGVHAAVGKVVTFGGDPKVHGEAHVDLWKRIEAFFKKHLTSSSCKAKL